MAPLDASSRSCPRSRRDDSLTLYRRRQTQSSTADLIVVVFEFPGTNLILFIVRRRSLAVGFALVRGVESPLLGYVEDDFGDKLAG